MWRAVRRSSGCAGASSSMRASKSAACTGWRRSCAARAQSSAIDRSSTTPLPVTHLPFRFAWGASLRVPSQPPADPRRPLSCPRRLAVRCRPFHQIYKVLRGLYPCQTEVERQAAAVDHRQRFSFVHPGCGVGPGECGVTGPPLPIPTFAALCCGRTAAAFSHTWSAIPRLGGASGLAARYLGRPVSPTAPAAQGLGPYAFTIVAIRTASA